MHFVIGHDHITSDRLVQQLMNTMLTWCTVMVRLFFLSKAVRRPENTGVHISLGTHVRCRDQDFHMQLLVPDIISSKVS